MRKDALMLLSRGAPPLLAMALLACAAAPPPAAQDPGRIEAGAEIAQAKCSACHAVGREGESPRIGAPAFRALNQRYSIEVLHEELISGLHVGVAEMPTFDLSIAEADALAAYLHAIQEEAE